MRSEIPVNALVYGPREGRGWPGFGNMTDFKGEREIIREQAKAPRSYWVALTASDGRRDESAARTAQCATLRYGMMHRRKDAPRATSAPRRRRRRGRKRLAWMD